MRPMTGCASKVRDEIDGDQSELRRGPWTLEEDTLLTHYVARNGEGRWNMVAKSAGLKRTGKSCRLRWLNYLKPDIKRGNLSPQEQLLILELHSKWGNRWSKIAQHLPGRTDNEIKNYWRTRVQKQARQLNIESNSQSFFDAVRSYWMPRLIEKMEQTSPSSSFPSNSCSYADISMSTTRDSVFQHSQTDGASVCPTAVKSSSASASPDQMNVDFSDTVDIPNYDKPSVNSVLLDSHRTALPQLVDISQLAPTAPSTYHNHDYYNHHYNDFGHYYVDMASEPAQNSSFFWPPQESHMTTAGVDWMMNNDMAADLSWNMDDIWQFGQ